ncbi:hypothetical protein B0O99DRAFT_614326 [Bisporella sp. PMI_857]|nr:hypothetical protein B0O99DRAFT_614326 [Bisporella sp. PMI_857]
MYDCEYQQHVDATSRGEFTGPLKSPFSSKTTHPLQIATFFPKISEWVVFFISSHSDLLSQNQISDTVTLGSTCISGGLLTSIYHRGRVERLHTPLVILSIMIAIGIYLRRRTSLDLLALVILPWTLAGGLLASRVYNRLRESDEKCRMEDLFIFEKRFETRFIE